jgi:DNA polymerase III delta prime subunit
MLSYLFRASLQVIHDQGSRELQSAEMYKIMGLLKLPYHDIGRIPAVDLLRKVIVNHIASNADYPEPLTVVFAGPPGHGKTELAQQLGDILSVEHETIACSQMRIDLKLLGSRLNNHLSQNSGSSSVAFLDEFDKTTTEICHALLTTMEGIQAVGDRCCAHD